MTDEAKRVPLIAHHPNSLFRLPMLFGLGVVIHLAIVVPLAFLFWGLTEWPSMSGGFQLTAMIHDIPLFMGGWLIAGLGVAFYASGDTLFFHCLFWIIPFLPSLSFAWTGRKYMQIRWKDCILLASIVMLNSVTFMLVLAQRSDF